MGKTNFPIRIWRIVLCGLVGSAMSVPASARDIGVTAQVDVHTTVVDVREVPSGPLAGLHFDAKIKGKMVDVYVAPMGFVKKYDVEVSKGQEVHLIGTETTEEGADVVLGREITTGKVDPRTGIFHENMTIYLRNDAGPLWE